MVKKQNKKSALLIIGNEILSGRTKDSNTQYIAEKMSEIGVPLSEVRVVPDIEQRVIEALNALRQNYDYVFTTGGIGPTHDDITSECIAKAFGVEYGFHPEAYKILEDYYGEGEFTDPRKKMAKMPVVAKLIPNPVSGAPGFYVENVFTMAGVPRIMQSMLDYIVTLLEHGDAVRSLNISVQQPESKIAQALGEIQSRVPEVDIGSYPAYRDGVHQTNIVMRSTDEALLQSVYDEVETLVKGL
ncbi:MAG: competence/damage-inducible protein A [Micavibrio sp. TMED27]|nr:competence/damage-inducible protein A [Micavibrio sp.]OUT91833.1 MAG: competence/damage-inducible protein A [Micavibrio sp. TMED27]|tara:strand:- start:1478 stop:2206 length:729 start_codon:yes stop_codon:yes gene_type:complete